MHSTLQNHNSNQLFYINSSEIEDRIDPYYYKKEFINLIKELKSNPLTKSLKSLNIHIKKGVFDMSPDKYTETGIPFLRVADITYEGMDFSSTVYINEKTHQEEIKTEFLPGDIVIAKIGHTIGKISILPNDFEKYNISQNVVGIKISDDVRSILNPEYLKVFLSSSLGKKQIIRHSSQGAQPKITLDSLRKIIIPLFPLEIQKQLVDSYFNALSNKKRKERETKSLLQSIDNYLLSELGIVLPERDDSFSNRVFEVNYSTLGGSRFDPDYISKIDFFINQKANYTFKTLGSLLVKSPQYGANETAINPSNDKDVRYIRITDINEHGLLKKEKWKTANTINDSYLLNFNDILFARSGSVGRCYIHKEISKKAIFAGYLIRFIMDESKVLPEFIFEYCNSSVYKYWVSAIERPAVQSNINSEEFRSLPIPIPPIEKQREIVNSIVKLREKAKELELEAKSGLKEAKNIIDQMILG